VGKRRDEIGSKGTIIGKYFERKRKEPLTRE